MTNTWGVSLKHGSPDKKSFTRQLVLCEPCICRIIETLWQYHFALQACLHHRDAYLHRTTLMLMQMAQWVRSANMISDAIVHSLPSLSVDMTNRQTTLIRRFLSMRQPMQLYPPRVRDPINQHLRQPRQQQPKTATQNSHLYATSNQISPWTSSLHIFYSSQTDWSPGHPPDQLQHNPDLL